MSTFVDALGGSLVKVTRLQVLACFGRDSGLWAIAFSNHHVSIGWARKRRRCFRRAALDFIKTWRVRRVVQNGDCPKQKDR